MQLVNLYLQVGYHSSRLNGGRHVISPCPNHGVLKAQAPANPASSAPLRHPVLQGPDCGQCPRRCPGANPGHERRQKFRRCVP